MIWAEKTSLIVMLCQPKENGKVSFLMISKWTIFLTKPQCEIYWADKQGNGFEVDNLKISVIDIEDINNNLKKRLIQIEVRGSSLSF